jgi:hypothetical protein
MKHSGGGTERSRWRTAYMESDQRTEEGWGSPCEGRNQSAPGLQRTGNDCRCLGAIVDALGQRR